MAKTRLNSDNLRASRGATLVEYVLLVSLIALTVIIGVRILGQNLNNAYTDIGDGFGSTSGGGGSCPSCGGPVP